MGRKDWVMRSVKTLILRPVVKRIFSSAAWPFWAAAMLLVLGSQASAQTVATPVTPQVTLPGGASSLSETHDDWTVVCTIKDNKKECEFSQAIGNKQTGQRILSIELQPDVGDKAHGVILAPFGLRLSDGLTLKVDDKTLGAPLAFTTCVEAGCIAPINFDVQQLATIADGSQMTVNAVNAGSGEPITLNISLKGFSAARKRASQLMK
jgi:invasion protein IalB